MSNERDPMMINTRRQCPNCLGSKRKRKSCGQCSKTGYLKTTDLKDLWGPNGSGFLVCGGPSAGKLDYWRLAERGIVSLGVNNAAGFAPCRAWCFSDPPAKFSHGLFLDPAIMTFAPTPKLGSHVRIKKDSGEFHFTDTLLRQCPNTWGYQRRTVFDPKTFFTDWFAHWGYGGKQGKKRSFSTINTMFCGVRLLHYLGIRRMFLVGVDFAREPDKFYAWNQDKGGRGGWGKSIKLWKMLQPYLEPAGVSIYNCNPESALDIFPHVPFDEALDLCQRYTKQPLDLAGWYNKKPVAAERDRIENDPSYEFYRLYRQTEAEA